MRVPIESKNILMVGFGKIGKIKAYKWMDRGYNVYVKDIKFCNLILLNKGISVDDDLSRQYFTIEICTPTNQHVVVLKNIVKKYLFSYVSIDKPLCNTFKDLEEITSIIKKQPDLEKNIFVSEQYFYSTILDIFSNHGCFSLSGTEKIQIEFSKNRISDNENGRFLDKEILGYGIELPHILAILRYLGISSDEFVNGVFVNNLYIKDLRNHDYSIEILSRIRNISIQINSNLGSFSIKDGKQMNRKNGTVRTARIDDSILIFDPHPKIERYRSELINGDNKIQISDDMIDKQLTLLEENRIPRGCDIISAIEITKVLLKLYLECNKIYV